MVRPQLNHQLKFFEGFLALRSSLSNSGAHRPKFRAQPNCKSSVTNVGMHMWMSVFVPPQTHAPLPPLTCSLHTDAGYLNAKCPASWTRGAGSSIAWPASAGFTAVAWKKHCRNRSKTYSPGLLSQKTLSQLAENGRTGGDGRIPLNGPGRSNEMNKSCTRTLAVMEHDEIASRCLEMGRTSGHQGGL